MTKDVPQPAERPAATLPKFESFDAFWGYYLGEHTCRICRGLHYVGAAVGVALAVTACVLRSGPLFACALPAAYLVAWTAHAVFERNRPATWRYPLWSFRAELRMCRLAASGRLAEELDRHGIPCDDA